MNSLKRACENSIVGESEQKKQRSELTLEDEVDMLYKTIKLGNEALDPTLIPISSKYWNKKLFEIIRFQPHEPKIWILAFEKLSLPMITIPLGHGLSFTLPSKLWEHHCSGQTIIPKKIDDVSEENIQEFIQCLQKCNSFEILNEENWQVIMKLAKRYSISWLFNECLAFGLDNKFGPLGKKASQEWGNFFKWNRQYNPCHLEFKVFQHYLSYLLYEQPHIMSDLSSLIPFLYPSETNNNDYTICFGKELKVTLPMYIWNAHSKFCWEKVNKELEDNVPEKMLETFARCLIYCTSYNILNLDNFVPIYELANKYQITWLLHDCEEFFKVNTISQAALFGFIHSVNESVVSLIERKTPLSLNTKNALNELADHYRLLGLKLFVNGFHVEILADGTLFVEMPEKGELIYPPQEPTKENLTLLQTMLAMHNPWDAPKIELNCMNQSEDHFSKDDFDAISHILKTSHCPILVTLDYCDTMTKTENQLSELLNEYPLIKHLKIILHGEVAEAKEPVLKMIRENTTLESLCLIMNDGIYLELETEYTEKNLRSDIKKALDESVHLKEVSLLYSDYRLDRTRSYVDDESILRDHCFKALTNIENSS